MAAVSTQSGDSDSWDQPSTSAWPPHTYTIRKHASPVPDDWDDSDTDEEYLEENNQKIWADANSKAPMPSVVISPSSTAPSVVSPPSTVFQSPLRILKRPSASSSASSAAGLQTHESLAEREAKYQVARERIFGGTDVGDAGSNECNGKDKESPALKTERGTPVHATNVVRNPRGPEEDARGFGGRQSRKVMPLNWKA